MDRKRLKRSFLRHGSQVVTSGYGLVTKYCNPKNHWLQHVFFVYNYHVFFLFKHLFWGPQAFIGLQKVF